MTDITDPTYLCRQCTGDASAAGAAVTTRYFRPADDMPRIYLYRDPVDFRKASAGQAAIVERDLDHNIFVRFGTTRHFLHDPWRHSEGNAMEFRQFSYNGRFESFLVDAFVVLEVRTEVKVGPPQWSRLRHYHLGVSTSTVG